MTRRPAAPFQPAVRELLAAVLDAIDIPFPATVGDHERYQKILVERAMHARITLQRVLELPGRLPLDLEFEVGYLRRKLADTPPAGYQVWQATAGRPNPRPNPTRARGGEPGMPKPDTRARDRDRF